MRQLEAFAVTGKTVVLWTVYPFIALWRAFTGGSLYYGMGAGVLGVTGLVIGLFGVLAAYAGAPLLAAGLAVGYYVFGLVANTTMQYEWQENLF